MTDVFPAQAVCNEVLKKRSNDPSLVFWRAFGLIMEGSTPEVRGAYLPACLLAMGARPKPLSSTFATCLDSRWCQAFGNHDDELMVTFLPDLLQPSP